MNPTRLPAAAWPMAPLLGALGALLPCSIASGQVPTLVRDINTTAVTASSSPGNFVTAGAYKYFSASEVATGSELYRTLGTPGSTTRLTDITVGESGSSPQYLTLLGTQLFFSAKSDVFGTELYVLDTAVSVPVATLVLDINAGPEGSAPEDLAVFNGAVYFSARSAASGRELWKSDGTAAGTVLVSDIAPGALLSSSPMGLVTSNGLLFFSASDESVAGRELWSTDGTAAGTAQITDIWPGSIGSSPTGLMDYQSEVYFRANDPVNGLLLWKSDGTAAGTAPMSLTVQAPVGLVVYAGELYFNATTPATGSELFKTDGTTVTAFDLIPGSVGSAPNSLNVFGTAPNELLGFRGVTASSGTELYVFDGTSALAIDVNPGAASSNPAFFGGGQSGVLFFQAQSAASGVELFKSDGTAVGTGMVLDINATSDSNPKSFTALAGGGVLFQADDGVHGTELWLSDGSAVGTVLLDDIADIDPTDGSDPSEMVAANGLLYFAATDTASGTELWRSDGTLNGTQMVADILPGAASSFPRELLLVGSKLFFVATSPTQGRELHVLDLATDTITVLEVMSGSFSAGPLYLAEFKGKVYFQADGPSKFFGKKGRELWSSDGTAAGTALVADIAAGPPSSFPDFLTRFNDRLYFKAVDNLGKSNLWSTDGTALGTTQLNVSGLSGSLAPEFLTVLGDRLLFVGETGNSGRELYSSDGTTAGTFFVDIFPGPPSSMPYPARTLDIADPLFKRFAVAGGLAFFRAENATVGFEVFRTDGTAAGTVLTKSIRAGGLSSSPMYLTPLGNEVLFSALDGDGFSTITGTELWKSDGSAAGTVQVADIIPGPGSSSPINLTRLGSRRLALTAASLGSSGEQLGGEMFVTDGTAAGTSLVADLRPGFPSGGGDGFTLANGKLFFTAAEALTGKELYVVDMGAVSAPYGAGCSDAGSVPVLEVDDPVLGSTIGIEVSAGPPNGGGIVILGSGASPSGILDFGGGCILYLDLSAPSIAVLPIMLSANGSGSTAFSIPLIPGLAGLTFGLQGAVGTTSTAPFGLDFTNLSFVTLGL